ncbi:MAG: carboxymuconolactone decarboxylase family protein [Rhodospirillales bacterium]
MNARLDYPRFRALAPATAAALVAISKEAKDAGLDPALLELVKIRASQINGCSFCLHMHVSDARRMGETAERLDLVAAWREAPVYTARERAALAWTESLTLVHDSHVPDADYEVVRQQFDEDELAALTAAVVAINGWNRIAVAYRFAPAIAAAPAARAAE